MKSFKTAVALTLLVFVLLSTTIGIVLSSLVQAAEATPREQGMAYAKHEAACYVMAVAAGIADASIHSSRARRANTNKLTIAYVIGYHSAVLDVFGTRNASKYDGYANARKLAAVELYKIMQCTTGEST